MKIRINPAYLILAVLLVGLFFIWSMGNTNEVSSNAIADNSAETTILGNQDAADSDEIRILKSSITTTAKFFDAEGSRYFVVRDSNGDIHTAFDACDVCGGKKGYRQQGTDMVCNNCGLSFSIESIGDRNKKGGGCWPSFLSFYEDGDYIVLSREEIRAGSVRF